jgi:hypothetical protein
MDDPRFFNNRPGIENICLTLDTPSIFQSVLYSDETFTNKKMKYMIETPDEIRLIQTEDLAK